MNRLPAERLLHPPRSVRVTAFGLVGAFAVLALALALLPWQQTAAATGTVTTLDPDQREQSVEATISGQVVRWLVREGQIVEEGQPLVELADRDAGLLGRLTTELQLTEDASGAADRQLEAFEEGLAATREARELSIASANAKVRVGQQKVSGAREAYAADQASLEAARLNLERVTKLSEKGLASTFDVENATLRNERARTSLAKSRAGMEAASAELEAAQLDARKVRQEMDAKVAEARTKLEKSRSDVASARQKVLGQQVKVERQRTQLIKAPITGTVTNVLAGLRGEQVKAGDPLARIIPTQLDRAVALYVDGNDVPLVTPGADVRLQFEGWPALQFAGWPSVAVGTFGGQVAFVDPQDDGKGRFRVVVVPDPEEPDWPEVQYLRRGVKAKGWVMLSRVSLGYEVWRQLNGFPQTIDRDPKDAKPPIPLPKGKK